MAGKQGAEAQAALEQALVEVREGAYRFASKARGQAGIIVEELIDPQGESVQMLADVEGEAGALALAMPIDLITMETWLLGQIGDQDQLDLDSASHRELWFNFGAWIGETLRRRHGGHWLMMGEDPAKWRLGFSKMMLELIPHAFALQLLQVGQGSVRKLVSEIERIRALHQKQKEQHSDQEIDRFTAEHYVRMHTIPLGQWMVMDLRVVRRLWAQAASRDLAKEVRKQGKRLSQANAPIVASLLEAIEKADGSKPIAAQTQDRGLFEAVAQIIGLKRTTAPVAMDVLENFVIPAMYIGIPEKFPQLDDDDFANLRKGMELFAVFADVVPHKFSSDDEGFLRAIPHEALSTPYGDRDNLEVGKGDWVVVDTKPFGTMLLEFDSHRLLASYDSFVQYVASIPKAPRRRDNGRLLAETVAQALADLKACVVSASKEGYSLLFRMLPPPP